jgi:hypothetical protein
MKKKLLNKRAVAIAAIVLAVLAIVAGAWALWPAGSANKPAGPQTLTGYLMCQNCGLKGKCEMNNADLTTHPEKYTLKCAKMPDCIASGYGVAVKQSNGKYKFYSFDSNGSILALDGIIFRTKRADNLLVQVRCTVKGDRIAVESVTEVLPAETPAPPVTKPAATK